MWLSFYERGEVIIAGAYALASVTISVAALFAGLYIVPTRLNRGKAVMKTLLVSWQVWALLSAVFAALTAIFAKIGVENVNSDFATFIRTIVILIVLGAILAATRQFQSFSTISGRSYLFLILSGMATGGSWVCYFRALKLGDAARVAPIDKLSVVLVAVFGVLFLKEHLSFPNWIGVSLIALGAVLVAYKG
jgi:transporter family protein